MIRVQHKDFDIGEELASLTKGRHAIGGVALFVGLVREMVRGQDGAEPISAMTLEHYPGMTEKRLAAVEAEAQKRWPLEATLIVHRYGRLEPGEQIVLVACASAHRAAALEACHFLIDWLKTDAPFWKLEEAQEEARWVDAQSSDDRATARWRDQPAADPAKDEAG